MILFKSKNLLELKKKIDKIKKVVMCSGKIYYDLIEAREKYKNDKLHLFELNNFILFQ